ncbi:hypothetical protein EG878_17600, partial [Enterococcus faecalis]
MLRSGFSGRVDRRGAAAEPTLRLCASCAQLGEPAAQRKDAGDGIQHLEHAQAQAHACIVEHVAGQHRDHA